MQKDHVKKKKKVRNLKLEITRQTGYKYHIYVLPLPVSREYNSRQDGMTTQGLDFVLESVLAEASLLP